MRVYFAGNREIKTYTYMNMIHNRLITYFYSEELINDFTIWINRVRLGSSEQTHSVKLHRRIKNDK